MLANLPDWLNDLPVCRTNQPEKNMHLLLRSGQQSQNFYQINSAENPIDPSLIDFHLREHDLSTHSLMRTAHAAEIHSKQTKQGKKVF